MEMKAKGRMRGGWIIRAQLAVSLLAILLNSSIADGKDEQVRDAPAVLLATTTSVRDSGLLDALLPLFTEYSGIRVRAVAVGTGAALRMGSEGNADILLTHAPEAEEKLLRAGALSQRRVIMENHFLLAGPPDDPARVREASDILGALQRIREGGAPFVSRGDDSGTHMREQALFRQAGLDPDAHWPGLTRTGSGMGLSLEVAGQRRAYILSDLGTFLAFRERVDLAQMSRGEEKLRNLYSILLVNSDRFPRVHSKQAMELADFLGGPLARRTIADFGLKRFGRTLFQPVPPLVPDE